MALIRVHCPGCRAELELDDRHAGQEVECGGCRQVFIVDPPGESAARPRPRRPRPDPDGDDFAYDRRRSLPRDEVRGGGVLTAISLILGVAGLPMGCCCGPGGVIVPAVGAVCGGVALGQSGGRALAVAGFALNVVGLGLGLGVRFFGFGNNLINIGL